jgi:antitoxin MazE
MEGVMTTQLARWGNSLAVRLPRSVLADARLEEGDLLEIRVSDRTITMQPANPLAKLEALVAQVTPENRHDEVDWGRPVGAEQW